MNTLTLTQICKETDKIFLAQRKHTKEEMKGLFPIQDYISGELEKVAEGWAGDLNITGYDIIPGASRLVIIAEDITQVNPKVRQFLFKFFLLGNKWQISCDLNGVSQEELVKHLLKHYSHKQ